MNVNFVNKTGRDLTIYSSQTDNVGTFFPADGPSAKNDGFNQRGKTVSVGGFPVTCAAPTPPFPRAEDISGIPDPVPGTVYIVPMPVEMAAAALGRTDCVRMGPGRFVDGKQVGADGFQSSLIDFDQR